MTKNITIGDIGRNFSGHIAGGTITLTANGSSISIPRQLPARAEYFINRASELKEILTNLQPGRVVTLLGPGGMGKSALAAEVLHCLEPDRFPDGIIWHSFYNQPQAVLALEHIVRSFGEEPKPTPRDAAKRVLANRRALLFLDGAEDADNLGIVLELRGNNCGVLVTSRKRSDALDQRLNINSLGIDEAVSLLQAWGGNHIDSEVATNICRLVGGLPSAVRLIGRYLRETDENATEYLLWLQERSFQALNQGNHTSLNIDQLLERSLAQVSELAQQILGVVGLLSLQPFGLEPLVAALQLTANELRMPLAELVNYGLLLRETYLLEVSHTLIYAYAREKLNPLPQITTRLVTYYTDLAKTESAKGLSGYRRLDTERAHLLQMVENCSKQDRWEAVLNIVREVDSYLDIQGHWTERVTLLEIGIKATRELENKQDEGTFLGKLGNAYRNLGQVVEAIESYEQAMVIEREIGDRQGEGVQLGNLGNAYNDLGQVEKAINFYQEALLISREIGDRRGESVQVGNLGNAYNDLGQVEKAINFYQEALLISREIGDRRGEGKQLGSLGLAYYHLGQVNLAIIHYEQALATVREIGNIQGEGIFLGNLGLAYSDLGQVVKAIEFYEQALAISREIGDRHNTGNQLGNLANAYISLGDVKRAVEFYQQALVISREIGNRAAEGNHLGNLGNAYRILGDIVKAVEYYQQALSISQEIGDSLNMSYRLGNLGTLYYDLGQIDKAIPLYEQALAISQKIEHHQSTIATLANLGNAYSALGQLDRAIDFYQQSLSLTREMGNQRGGSIQLGNLGTIYLDLKQVDKAIEYYQQALSISRELGDTVIESQLLYNLAMAYKNIDQIPQAITLLEKALPIFRQYNNSLRVAKTLEQLGLLERETKQFNQAKEYWLESKAIYHELKDPCESDIETHLNELALIQKDIFPLLSIAQAFLNVAGFELIPSQDETIFVGKAKHRMFLSHFPKPIFIQILSGVQLNAEQVRFIQRKVAQDSHDKAFVIIDQTPTDDGWLQIATARLEGIQIIPIDDTVIVAGAEEERQTVALNKHLKRFIGNTRNLYDVRDPVADRLSFFGREMLANELMGLLKDARPVGLFGLRKMGKSSLLKYLRDNLPIPTALIDLQAGFELVSLYERILVSWSRSIRVKVKDLEWTPPSLGDAANISAAFTKIARELLTCLEDYMDSPQLCVFVDEIDLIPRQDNQELSNYLAFGRALRGLFQEEEGRFIVLVAGVNPAVNRESRLFAQQNPFYQFFTEHYLPTLNRDDCVQMIHNIGRQMNLEYDTEAALLVAKISGGHPYLARQLCSLVFQQLGRPGYITMSVVQESIQRFITNPKTSCLLDEGGLWNEMTNSSIWLPEQVTENEAILKSLAQIEPQPKQQFVTQAIDQRACEHSLYELENRAVLNQDKKDSETSLKIQLSLFRNWIRRYKLGEKI